MSTEQGDTPTPRRRPRVGDVIARRVSAAAIRDAMFRRHVTLKGLAALTCEADPAGQGVSWQLVSLLASGAWWGRDTTTLESARLICKALEVPEETLFARESVTSRRATTEAAA